MSRKSVRRQRKFARWAWTIGIVLFVVAGTWLVLSSRNSQRNPNLIQVHSQPAIRVDQQQIDFGDVNLGVDRAFTITVTNVGDQPLRFAQAPYIEVVEGC